MKLYLIAVLFLATLVVGLAEEQADTAATGKNKYLSILHLTA